MLATITNACRLLRRSNARTAFACALVLGAAGCQSSSKKVAEPAKPARPAPETRTPEPESPPVPEEAAPPREDAITQTIVVPDRSRWYWVERYQRTEEAEGFEATFDRARNKIDIRTNGVTHFAIDTSRIPINWDRLVILGIDGRNSELRQRDFDVFHFEKDRHGKWVVEEP